jgi:hypothetical protein
MSSQRFHHHSVACTIAALALFFSLLPPAASAAAPYRPAPEELLLNTTFRHAAIEPDAGAVAAARFRMEIPQAGLLALDLSLLGAEQPEPLLRVLGFSSPTSGATLKVAAQTPGGLLAEVEEAGTLLVEVAALEPDLRLPAFRLRSAFRADSAAGSRFEKDVDPWDDDLDGRKPPPPPAGATTAGDELCVLVEQDDHGDVPLCATPIGSAKAVAGVLHNDAGDDEDLFVFRLPATAAITVEVLADSAVQLVLRDRDGLAVAINESEGGGTPLRPPALSRQVAISSKSRA